MSAEDEEASWKTYHVSGPFLYQRSLSEVEIIKCFLIIYRSAKGSQMIETAVMETGNIKKGKQIILWTELGALLEDFLEDPNSTLEALQSISCLEFFLTLIKKV